MTYRVEIKPYRGYSRTFKVFRWQPEGSNGKFREWQLSPKGEWRKTCFATFLGDRA